MRPLRLANDDVALVLERIADLLEAQDANPFRVRAYRGAADSVRAAPRPLADILEDRGVAGLDELPGIGRRVASLIAEFLHTGRSSLLDRLEGQISPEDLFTTVPGIGEELAARIHRELGIETLEELEQAAHDGRLADVRGFGARRVRGVRDALEAILSRSTRRRARRRRWLEQRDRAAAGAAGPARAEPAPGTAPAAAAGDDEPPPPVGDLLAVDAEYRRRVAAGTLRRIAPRRFNPRGEAWLPVLHAERGGFDYTALFSNTARAHELGMTNDWVVLYAERDGYEEQWTVVTERRGPLAGRRVVRGREAECARHYGAAARSGA